MKGIRLTRNNQNARFWEIFGGKSYAVARACADIVVFKSPHLMGIPFSEGAFFSKLKSVYSGIPKLE